MDKIGPVACTSLLSLVSARESGKVRRTVKVITYISLHVSMSRHFIERWSKCATRVKRMSFITIISLRCTTILVQSRCISFVVASRTSSIQK